MGAHAKAHANNAGQLTSAIFFSGERKREIVEWRDVKNKLDVGRRPRSLVPSGGKTVNR